MAKLKYVLKTRDFTKDFHSSNSAKLALVKYTIEEIHNGYDSADGHLWYTELNNIFDNYENSYGTIFAEIDREAERNRTY